MIVAGGGCVARPTGFAPVGQGRAAANGSLHAGRLRLQEGIPNDYEVLYVGSLPVDVAVEEQEVRARE